MASRRKKAETELSSKERWLSRLLETLPYFYFVTLCLACAELCGYH